MLWPMGSPSSKSYARTELRRTVRDRGNHEYRRGQELNGMNRRVRKVFIKVNCMEAGPQAAKDAKIQRTKSTRMKDRSCCIPNIRSQYQRCRNAYCIGTMLGGTQLVSIFLLYVCLEDTYPCLYLSAERITKVFIRRCCRLEPITDVRRYIACRPRIQSK